ncbi:molybdopterin molybdotransferase [Naumannella cuiyingiana]|uniref:Molybdopterin molybdenumtransferase n=1 Tax=Naumannella cuiyingiana TaxID=1347891 RepID=A0A7Z0D9Y7_9ACTN|nr:molybdopterin molybdotransferase [Naumannella cuiyingiana]
MPLFGRRKKQTEVAEQPEPEAPRLPDPPAPSINGLRSMQDHRDYLLSLVEPLPPFGQNLIEAQGLSLCEDIVSHIDLPGFDNSAMDGYAVRCADVAEAAEDNPVDLPVVGEIAAGDGDLPPLAAGTVVKIMTGAPVPDGAEAVIPYEGTNRGSETVRIFAPGQPGLNIRRRGEDVTAGTLLLNEGDLVAPRNVGLMAGVGIDKVLARPRPRVVVISTGSELVQPGNPLTGGGQIYDSNSYLLAAAAKAAGAQVYRVGLVSDDPDEIKQTISDQLVRADLLVSSGGVSQGDYDLVKSVLPELGLTDFTEVAMQPGKPQGFGLIGEHPDDRVPMIMVPGNPVSAFVSFEAFVRPVIRKLMGVEPYVRPSERAFATKAIRSVKGKLQLARGIVTADAGGRRTVELVGGHGSHLMGDLARANALVLLGPETEVVPAGQPVAVWMLADG